MIFLCAGLAACGGSGDTAAPCESAPASGCPRAGPSGIMNRPATGVSIGAGIMIRR